MPIAEWDDGYMLDTDFRREDPIYYYVLKNEWKNAIGIAIDPAYNVALAKEVKIAFYALPSAGGMPVLDEKRKFVLLRILPVLMQRYPGWKSITIKDEFLPAMRAELDALFEQAQFKVKSTDSAGTTQTWQRAGWLARLCR